MDSMMDSKRIKIGDRCYVKEETKNELGLADDIVYVVHDFLNNDVDFPIVLKTDKFGKDWVEFFREDELILINK